MISKKSPKLEPIDSPTDQLDLTGTPLEDECEMDLINTSLDLNDVLQNVHVWTDAEECMLPISIDNARYILFSG